MWIRTLFLAVCAACTSAWAQTVSLYGVADAAVEVVSAKGATAGRGLDRGRVVQLGSDSYIGIQGSEWLGPGVEAVFQLEADLSLDDGGFDEFTRDTFVGLRNSAWGSVRLGRNSPPMRDLGESFDLTPGGDTGIGAIQSLLGINGLSTGSEDRRSNSLRYLPPLFLGVRLDLVYETAEARDAIRPVEEPGEDHGRTTGIGATWEQGGLFAGYAYDQRDDSLRPGLAQGGGKERRHRMGMKYEFSSGLMLGGFYDRASSSGDFDGADGRIRKDTWGAIGQWESGPHSFYLMLAKARPLDCSGAATGGGSGCESAPRTGARLATVGYNYRLSKRTLVRAALSFIDNDSAARYAFSSSSTRPEPGADPRGVTLGLRHHF